MTDDGYGSGPDPRWLHEDWAAHLRWVEVDGRPVNVCDVGDGEQAIVFVHGHSACWQHWLEQLPVFADRYRCIALDLPGFGRSPMPDDLSDVDMSHYADVVDSVCDQLGLDRVTVVGNSMGGFVAADLALRHPDRVDRLVLVSAAGMAGRYIGLPTTLITHPTGVAAGRVLLGLGGLPSGPRRFLARRARGRRFALGFVCRHAERLHPAMVYELTAGAGAKAAAPAAVALAGYDFKDRVADIACPTLIVWGDVDHLVPVSSAGAYAAAIPDATMVNYVDCGHLPMVERPGRFNADLEAFLRGERVGERPEKVVAAA